MGTTKLYLTVLFSSFLLSRNSCSAQTPGNVGPPQGTQSVQRDVDCSDSGNISLTMAAPTGNRQSKSFNFPCLTSITHLIIKFDEFPFDCRRNDSFIKYSVPQAGLESKMFCKVGTTTENDAAILVDDTNTAVIRVALTFGIMPTVTYVSNGTISADYPTVMLVYEFLDCSNGISGTSCITTTSTSTSSTVTSSTSTTTSTSTTSTTTSTSTTSTSTTPTTPSSTSTTPLTSTEMSTRVYDGTFCVGFRDPYPGSHVVWSDADPGHTDSKECPFDAEGTATRRCINNSTDPGVTQAIWELPDLSNCVSPFFKQILITANELSKQAIVDPTSIIDITSAVTNATINYTGSVLYAGDLSVAAETVGLMADVLTKSDPGRKHLQSIAKGCSNVVSNIIDPSTVSVWKFTRNGYIENKVTTILDSVEKLSANVANQFSKIMTSRAKRATIGNVKSENMIVAVRNLDLTIHVLDRAENFSRVVDEQLGADEENGIVLPDEVFTNAVQGTSDPYIHVYYAKFPSIANLVASTDSKIIGQRHVFEPYVNSEVIASKILNADQSLFQSLISPVKITLSMKNAYTRVLSPHCVFLNMSAITNEDRWSRTGCIRSTLESDENATVCYCYHLTNFAVLMDIYDVENSIDDFDAKILTYLSYGGGGLSILGCCISIVIFEFFRLKNQRVRIHEQLAVTIILVQLFFMVGIDRTENKYVCKVLAICLHYVLVAMFCWMLVEGAHLYLVLVKVFKSRSNMKKYVLLGWGVPLILVGISAGIFHDDYGTGTVCWITHKVLLVAFVPAVSLVIVINTVVLIVVMKIMFNSMAKGSKSAIEERSSVKSGLKAACVLLPLLGLTWVFGYLSITSKETLIFTYLFTFFNSMQGVFFFVFHCLLSVDVQNAYERHNRRRSQIRLTESSLSKRTRKGSGYDSSDYSGGFRDSVKTATTSANSTLNGRVSNLTGEHNGRSYSVSFDDDVFITSPESTNDKLHRRTSESTPKPINIGIDTPHRRISNSGNASHDITERHNSHVMNNIIRGLRHNSESSETGYVLYYGSSTPTQKNDIQTYSSFDKNAIYATVKK